MQYKTNVLGKITHIRDGLTEKVLVSMPINATIKIE